MRISIGFCSFIFGLLFLLLSHIKLTAQQVDFYCTKVDIIGDITLSWQSSGLPANYQYEIYGSTSKTGTFSLLGTITVLTTTNFVHASANGDAQQWFYVIKAVPQPPAPGIEYVSDTIGSIFFTLFNLGGEIAALYWTHPSSPPLNSQAKEFVINRQRSGSWSYLASTDTLMYMDTVHVCGESLGYEIRLYDSIGCESISMVRTDIFTDFTPPATPQLDSVSINPSTGKTELGWERGYDSDVFGYIICILDNGIWKVIDTVMGAEITHYIDNVYDANNNMQQYRIAAIDTCRNASPMGAIHNTMLLSATTGKCDSIFLLWNPYNGMPDGVTNYRIWVSENGSSFVMLDVVAANQLSYIHIGVNIASKYEYYVQAYSSKNGYSASSAKTEIGFNYKKGSGNVLMRYASVINNQDIEIVVFVEDSIDWENLFLFKSDDGKATFSQIDAQFKVNGVENYSFIDNNADVHQHTYFYTVSLADMCEYVFAHSDTANNVVLQPKASANDEIAIEWQAYYGFKSRLDSYDALRRTQTETMFRTVGNVPPTQYDYRENVWNAANNGGKFFYQVTANEDNTNVYGFQDKSYSNIVEISKEAITYIPNIFCPNSQVVENRVFKPVNSYVDVEEYVLSIYDRWGSLIFTTNDINMGWDGSTNGKHAETGVYSYILTYRIDQKTMFKKQGHVTLVR